MTRSGRDSPFWPRRPRRYPPQSQRNPRDRGAWRATSAARDRRRQPVSGLRFVIEAGGRSGEESHLLERFDDEPCGTFREAGSRGRWPQRWPSGKPAVSSSRRSDSAHEAPAARPSPASTDRTRPSPAFESRAPRVHSGRSRRRPPRIPPDAATATSIAARPGRSQPPEFSSLRCSLERNPHDETGALAKTTDIANFKPPCKSTHCLTIARPSPVPGILVTLRAR